MPEAPQDPRTLAEALARALDRTACGVVAHDRGGGIVYINERLEGWLGYTSGELVGGSVESLAVDAVRDLVAAEAGDERARLNVLRRKDGTTFPVVALPQAGGVLLVIDLGNVQTAKPLDLQARSDVRATLGRIGLELQSLSGGTDLPPGPVPLHHPDLSLLSPREMEVLSLLMGGLRAQTIAEQLEISPHTVRNHLKSIYRKTGVQRQSELIQWVRSLVE